MLRLRAGTATLLIGPRSAAGMHGSRYCLDSETDIRQRLTLALQDPASREAMRRFWAPWQSDARLAGVKDHSIVDRIARMGVRGPLIVFVAVDTSVHRRDTFASRSKQVAEALQSGTQFKPWNGPVKPPALIAVSSIAPAAAKVPTPVDRSTITPPKKAVGDWTIAEKLAAIVVRAADSRKLPLDTRKQLKEKLSDSKFLAWLVGSLLVWFVSQFVVFGEILDMLLAGAALVLSGAGIFFTPQSLVAATHLVGQFVETTRTARDEKDLDATADILAEIIAIIGIPVLIAALAHATTRATSEGQKASTVKMPAPARSSAAPRFVPRPSPSTEKKFANESAQAKVPVGAEGGGVKQGVARLRRWLLGHFTQQNSNSCVIASTRNMIYAMTGENVSEDQLQSEMRTIMGEPNHDFETDPIDPAYAVTLLNQHGVQTNAPALNNIASDQLPNVLQDGKPALIGFKNPGHRVMLDSVKTDSNGNRTYIVRDPDPAYDGRPREMSQQDFDAKYNPQAIVIVAK